MSSSVNAPPDYLGARGDDDRRKGERRARPRPGIDRRRGDRRRAMLRSTLLAAAAMTLPHQVKPESLKPSLTQPPRPAVTTTIDNVVPVPREHAYDDFIEEASAQYGVDAALIRSVVQMESSFDALAVSRSGAMGLMQLMPDLAEELGVQDPFDPRQNVMGGARYLRRLLDLYRGNVRLALASYNAGTTTVAQYGGVPPFRETQNYVKNVTKLVNSSRRARRK